MHRYLNDYWNYTNSTVQYHIQPCTGEFLLQEQHSLPILITHIGWSTKYQPLIHKSPSHNLKPAHHPFILQTLPVPSTLDPTFSIWLLRKTPKHHFPDSLAPLSTLNQKARERQRRNAGATGGGGGSEGHRGTLRREEDNESTHRRRLQSYRWSLTRRLRGLSLGKDHRLRPPQGQEHVALPRLSSLSFLPIRCRFNTHCLHFCHNC